MLSIDEHPLSRWSTDGIVCATPTGSTAYAWSAGGPAVWPDIEAIMGIGTEQCPHLRAPTCRVSRQHHRAERPGRHRGTSGVTGRRRFDLLEATGVIRRSHQPVLPPDSHAAAFGATGRSSTCRWTVGDGHREHRVAR